MTSDEQGKSFADTTHPSETFFLAYLKADFTINYLSITFGLIQTISSFQSQSDILS